ncbi:MAG: N-acetyltransferase family protein [Promethearchaeota archaeon]|jgi:RimJ/RimL family protein N-acetyltransferase
MKLYYRNLTTEDIPAIKEISKDIWEGEDYVPHIIENWLQDEKCMNYGAFIDEKKVVMVGFGRVKHLTKDIAWLEGGRVKKEYQKQGIGRGMTQYALDYSYQAEAKVAQYDTSSKNRASIALAKYFGFKRKKSMNVLGAERKEIRLFKPNSLEVKKISADEAKEIYKNFDIGIGDEVCMGWSYKPIKTISEEDGEWCVINSKAILQTVKFKSITFKESPEEKDVWMIIYGQPEIATEYIQFELQKELKNKENKNFEVFCHPEIAERLEKLGFSYHDGEPSAVVLYEKIL